MSIARRWRWALGGASLRPMKLSEKGRYAPPPKLKSAGQRVSEALAAWDRVHARAHWLLGDETVIDGADFYLGDEELGHLHLDSEAHVALPAAVGAALIARGLASRFPWSRAFVVFRVEGARDVEHALWLFRLSYDRRSGATNEELLARVSAAKEARAVAHAV